MSKQLEKKVQTKEKSKEYDDYDPNDENSSLLVEGYDSNRDEDYEDEESKSVSLCSDDDPYVDLDCSSSSEYDPNNDVNCDDCDDCALDIHNDTLESKFDDLYKKIMDVYSSITAEVQDLDSKIDETLNEFKKDLKRLIQEYKKDLTELNKAKEEKEEK